MKNAVGYLRISTEDQSFWSLSAQSERIKEYCNKNHLNLLHTFKDNGQSGGSFNRKEWKNLERFIKYNKVSVLLVLKYDRFSRNLTEALVKIQEFESKHNIRVVSILEDIGVHHDSPIFFATRTQLLLNAHMERLNIKERTKIGLNAGARSGRLMHKAPFGYQNKRDKDGKAIIEIVPEQAHIIEYIFQSFLQGNRIKDIREEAIKKGMTLSGRMAIQRVISNPVYAGKIKVGKGELVPGLHTPIVGEQTFNAANALLRKDTRRIQYNDNVYLRGILYCTECGSRLTSTRAKKKYHYYECKGSMHRLHFNAKKAHAELYTILDHFTFRKEHISYLRDTLNRKSKYLIKETIVSHKKEVEKYKLIEEKIESLQEKFILSEIDNEIYKKFLEKFSLEKENALNSISKSKMIIEELDVIIDQELNILKNIKELFKELDVKGKQKFMELVFGKYITYGIKGYQTRYLNSIFMHNGLALNKIASFNLINEATNNGFEPLGDPREPNSELIPTIRAFYNLLKHIA